METVRSLHIPQEDRKEALTYCKERLFNLGLYGIMGDTLYPKAKDSERFYGLLEDMVNHNSSENGYTDTFKRLYADKYTYIESNMIKVFKKYINENATPCMIFRIIREEVEKEWGEFYE